MLCGIGMNLVEVAWKSTLKTQYPNPNDYSSFLGRCMTATGTVTFVMMLLSRPVFGKCGLGTAAFVTPTVLLGTGALLVCPSHALTQDFGLMVLDMLTVVDDQTALPCSKTCMSLLMTCYTITPSCHSVH